MTSTTTTRGRARSLRQKGPWHTIARRVNSARNSIAGSWKLDGLDWSSWYTDLTAMPDHIYLHVPAKPDPLMDGTVHRVYPREIKGRRCVRLSMRSGELFWLYDLERTKP